MNYIEIEWINNNDDLPLPSKATNGSAGFDVCAAVNETTILEPMQRRLIPLGFRMKIPSNFEIQIRPRSGNALKYGVTILNSPGTIDSDYRGEIGVILVNLSQEEFIIQNGERIAQMVISRHEQASWVEVNDLEKTERGDGGFGSTGKT